MKIVLLVLLYLIFGIGVLSVETYFDPTDERGRGNAGSGGVGLIVLLWPLYGVTVYLGPFFKFLTTKGTKRLERRKLERLETEKDQRRIDAISRQIEKELNGE